MHALADQQARKRHCCMLPDPPNLASPTLSGGLFCELQELWTLHASRPAVWLVCMQKRDPGRTFVLGERLLYVLLAGIRLQDDAAEDPLTAARQGSAADYDLYWHNKLLRPLSEVFAVCLPPNGLQVGACYAQQGRGRQ